MRIHAFLLALPLGLLPLSALAQAPPVSAAPPGPQAPIGATAEVDEDALPTTYGSVDFGVRGTTVDGDAARYERYRDLGSGLFMERARASTQKNGWLLDLGVDHLGRRDQRYAGSATIPGQVKLWSQWDQIPMLMSRTTQTLFTVPSPGVLEIDDAIQAAVQANPAFLATAVQSARQFDLELRRHIFDAGGKYIAKNGLIVLSNVRHTDRKGSIPFGGSFGHSNVVETVSPIRQTTTDFDTSAEYVNGDLLVRGGYNGSWFRNDVTTLTFDNPWRLQDIVGTSGHGRSALAPNNSFIGVNGLLSYKLPYKSRASVYASTGSLRDTGAGLLPFTVNTALVSPALDRATTEGHAETSSLNLTFTSRPTRSVDIDVRFKTYDYDNRTPEFLVTQRVAYDNSVSTVTNVALQKTEPFSVNRATFDADVRYYPIPALSTSIGFSHLGEERTHRIYEEAADNTFRLSVDSIGNPWFTLRSKYEHSKRRGEGDPAVIGAELNAIGEQAGMRHFDIASRDRDRITLLGMFVPANTTSVNVSYAAGKDDYLESEFGMRDNNHRVYSAGFEYAPSEYLGAGLSYSFERYEALSRSRQSGGPPPNPEFSDPSRNWATDSADQAHSVIGHLEILQYIRNVDITLFGDYSKTKGTYHYTTGAVVDRTLPEEIIVPSTLPPPTQLPDVKSELARVNLDVTYTLSERWSLGASVWYERYRVEDFSLDAEALTRLDPQGALLLGYQYLPYTAMTFWGRAVYKF